MDAAKRREPDETEPLTWAEIGRRYPDQYVCLVDVVHPRRGDPDIVSARVVGNGATHDAAFRPIRDLGERYPRFAIRYTGICTEPLIRPSLVIADETLKLLAAPLKRPSLASRRPVEQLIHLELIEP